MLKYSMPSEHDSFRKPVVEARRKQVLLEACLTAGERLGLQEGQIFQAVDWDPCASSSSDDGQAVPDAAIEMVKLYEALYKLVGGNDDQVRLWMSSNCSGLHGVPLNLVLQAGGLSRVLRYIEWALSKNQL